MEEGKNQDLEIVKSLVQAAKLISESIRELGTIYFNKRSEETKNGPEQSKSARVCTGTEIPDD